ncbi:MAG TPA: carboxylating nicotinate-nucleotide diphosphorylase [Gaiellaceae bacterium]|nr:carboxylating nicotinate-nucleotide diphosphorylase [Gaiellaceae bacterium]
MELSKQAITDVVALALREDVGSGDLTTRLLVPPGARCRAQLLLEEPGVVCGLPIATAVFQTLDPTVVLTPATDEGTRIGTAPVVLAELAGPAAAILTGERTALNLVARLCGIATLTRRFVDQIAGTGVTILDTRKTTPGLRALEKYAVRCGGGQNHRFGLDDAILVKENHLRIAGGIGNAAAKLAGHTNGTPVEVEAETLDQVAEALEAGVERILLDNMTPDQISQAVELTAGRAKLEASGGITLGSVRAYAETGVDYISIGALTHAARSLHLSLELQ